MKVVDRVDTSESRLFYILCKYNENKPIINSEVPKPICTLFPQWWYVFLFVYSWYWFWPMSIKRTPLLRPANDPANDLNHDDPNNNASIAACKTEFDYFVVSDFRSFVLLPP